MSRNPEKNAYVTIAFARTSPTLEYLQREATDMGISIADLIKVLLADRIAVLKGLDNQDQFLHEETLAQPSSVRLEKTDLPPLVVGDDVSRRAATAASAASYWDD